MKALRYSLKSVLGICMILSLFLTSCKDNGKDPAPDLATQIEGNYAFTEVVVDGQTVPASQTNIKGTVKITRATETTVDVDLNIRQKTSNEEFLVGKVTGVVASQGSGIINLIYEGENVGSVKGNKLSIKSVDENDEHFTLVAVK
ncbi:hypothetical protein [Emticicia sp. C21]|uniref:hypothetical protein n=1 Tax=Emticicia sp. C21 TaxID=2302915 RepID=UPI000E346F14|nr:hypothetical protein [Emticicia sp. C21]RFS16166.1 hypothetical protein D0T08_10770 [Emticicia sp. C21]